MRILVDENVPKLTVQTLRSIGHDVLDVRGTPEQSSPDEYLWFIAQREHRMVISTDRHFERYTDEQHQGILMVCIKQGLYNKINRRMIYALARFNEKRWRNLTVLVKDEVMNVWHNGGWIQYKLPKL